MNAAAVMLVLGVGAALYAVLTAVRQWHRVGGHGGGFVAAAPSGLAGAGPLWTYLIAMSVALGITKGHYGDWDAARLAVSVAWARGLPVYAGFSEGAVHNTMYPPVWLLAYLPASWGRTPTEVMAIGYALAPVLALVPVAVAAAVTARCAALTLVGLFLFTASAVHVEPLWWACFFPHADAPSLGLGLLAVLGVHAAWRRPHGRAAAALVTAGAAAACLAAGAKQVMVFLLPILLGGLLVVRAWRLAVGFVCAAVGTGLLLAVWAVWAFDPATLWLNLVVIPGGCPWMGTFPFNLLAGLRVLALPALPPLVVIIVIATTTALASNGDAACARRLRPFWPWLLAAGVGLVPISVMGFIKVGGALNSLSPSLYFIYAAAVVQILEAAPVRATRNYYAGLWLLGMLIAAVWLLGTLQELRYGLRAIQNSPCQQAYDYLRAGSGPRAFFPAYPLAHLLAENQWHHFVLAMVDREQIGGVPMTPAHRARHWPADIDVVCWTARQFASEYGGGAVYFPDHQTSIAVPDLPAFRCLARAPPNKRQTP